MKLLKKIRTVDDLDAMAAALRRAGKRTMKAAGCDLYVSDGGHVPAIIAQFLGLYPPATRRYLAGIGSRYGADTITAALKALGKKRALVIGDGILDEYHYCESMGRSSKEPLVVQRYLNEEVFAGGAFAAANHIAELCGKVTLVSVLGDRDRRENFIRGRLGRNVRPRFFTRSGSQTILKKRFIEKYSGSKLFEICHMDKGYVSSREESAILAFLERELPRHDMALALDFGHGLFTGRIIRMLEKKAGFLAVNVQTNSANSGFNMITKYRRADFASITELEARLACHDEYGPTEGVLKSICSAIGSSLMLMTRGKHGSMGYSPRHGFVTAPALASRVVDRVGAGDAFFSYAAPCAAAGLPPDLVSFVGNAAGAIAVQIVCNKEPVRSARLFELISSLLA
ncbi:MAG TPA: PfkB family carbohydrate kinase [Elusimicrobiales bacterium]|nr:PfkB family carbohydrate kinase [Elusimicrobiales bacterium]